jgi:hypothetical protein
MLSPKEFQELYISMYEARDDDAKEMRRLAAAERRAGNSDRMDAKTASKYAGSEAQSAARADKKSKGKHIHGYAIGESAVPGKPAEKLGAVTSIPKDEQDAARQRTLAKAAAMRAKKGITKEELELQLRAHLRERALDTSEKKEKESVYKAIKPSKLAKTYPEKSPEELKRLRFAISTAQAKKNMDTSRSDKRYGVEG